MSVTRRVVRALTSAPVAPLFRPFVRTAVPIFMLHRFKDPELGSVGTDPAALRAQLEYLRRHKIDLLRLSDLVDTEASSSRGPGVAFTVDDGYTDFATVAAPVFEQFDCPVTVFIVTGVVDNNSWFWWDRVDLMFERTQRSAFVIDVNGRDVTHSWADPAAKRAAAASFIAYVKTIPDSLRIDVLDRLPVALDVELPSSPPIAFRSMSWSDLRRFDRGGLVSFGPHTITHPALPQTTNSESAQEILGSWSRLQAMCHSTMPVFCYPSGAYSEREVTTLGQSDLIGALTSEHRYASRSAFASSEGRRRFAVPRVGCHDDALHFLQIATGVERVKLGIRRGRRGWSTGGAPPMG